MLITATFFGCLACVKAYQLWVRPAHGQASEFAGGPSVGLNGMLVESRK